jgi:hypothetical protein
MTLSFALSIELMPNGSWRTYASGWRISTWNRANGWATWYGATSPTTPCPPTAVPFLHSATMSSNSGDAPCAGAARRIGRHGPAWTGWRTAGCPTPRISHPWPSVRFRVKHPRWQPYAGIPPVRFCAGRARKWASLPRFSHSPSTTLPRRSAAMSPMVVIRSTSSSCNATPNSASNPRIN